MMQSFVHGNNHNQNNKRNSFNIFFHTDLWVFFVIFIFFLNGIVGRGRKNDVKPKICWIKINFMEIYWVLFGSNLACEWEVGQ